MSIKADLAGGINPGLILGTTAPIPERRTPPAGLPTSSAAPRDTSPKAPLVTFEQVASEQDKVETFLYRLYHSHGQASLQEAYDALSSTTQDEMAYWVWVSDGCPTEADYGKIELARNFSKLLSIRLPFLYPKGENIVEQWMYCLENAKKQKLVQHLVVSLQQLNHFCQATGTTNEYLQRLFLSLPSKIQEQLILSVLEVIDMPASHAPECRERILKDVSLLIHAKKKGSTQNVIDTTIATLQTELHMLREGEKQERKTGFLTLLDNPSLSRRQKKTCYHKLPDILKPEVPSPPYYGYGVQNTLHHTMGSHPCEEGTRFAVHAPHAQKVYVITTYNGEEQRRFEMENDGSGTWKTLARDVHAGTTYQYEIRGHDGSIRRKIDPFAMECWRYDRPHFHYESVVRDTTHFPWTDGDWMEAKRKCVGSSLPMNIYKMHPGSWKKKDGAPYNYRELADHVAAYCKDMGFTHIELMGILEHPSEGSQGYQPLNLFSINSRHGDMYDFQHLVDTLHKNGIGVFVDFVDGHFCVDDFGLRDFDGGHVFEHSDHLRAYHPSWGAYKFNYENPFVRNYAHSAARSWAERFHIDGFRIDAVDSTLEMNNGRPFSECHFTNREGTTVDLEARTFMKDFNAALHRDFPGTYVVAESSAHGKMTSPPREKGFGFDAKWAMGGMYDLLHYFQRDPIYRSYHQHDLLHAPEVEVGEHVVYAFSHDQVGHESLFQKMPGDAWRKYANLRLFYSFVSCIPGRKLMFMGDEIGQSGAWIPRLQRGIHEDRSLEAVQWGELAESGHRGIQRTVQALNTLYRENKCLWDSDVSSRLQWIDTKDTTNCVVSFHRGDLACIMNCSPNYVASYDIHFPADAPRHEITRMEEIFNSDAAEYGGSGKTNPSVTLLKDSYGKTTGFKIQMPPLACVILKEHFS
jgi:1,4-alpha-glucan branching enzyme